MNYGSKRPPHPIVAQLKAARLAHGWSQARMADESPVHAYTIGFVESGKTTDPHLWTLVDMAGSVGKAIVLVDEEDWW